MSSLFLLIPILLPIITGIILRIVNITNEKIYKTISLVSVILTSLITFVFLFTINSETSKIIILSEKINLGIKLDGLGKIFAGMVSLLWPFSLLYSYAYMKDEERKEKYNAYYVMTFGVVLGISFASNLFTLFIFYELLTIVTLPLIVHTYTPEARKAGRYYLYFSLTGSSLALVGLIILLHLSGSCEFTFGGLIESNSTISLVAYLLTFLGFGVKSAVFPLCFWLPMAGAAPTPTTALLHAVAVVKAGVFAIMRSTFYNFNYNLMSNSWVQVITIIMSSITILYGSMMALKEQHFKRRLAYSTISNLSYILLAVSFMNKTGLLAAVLHMLFHSFAKICLFFTCGAIIKNSHAHYVYELNGLGKKMPITFINFTIASLSLIGVPLFAGFISKWYIGMASIELGNAFSYIGIGCILVSALLTAVYTLNIPFRAFMYKPNEINQEIYDKAQEPNKLYLSTFIVFSALSIILGIISQPFVELIASILLGGVI